MHSVDRLFGQADQARTDGRYAEARASLDALILIARLQANDILRAQALTAKALVEREAGHSVAAVPLYEEAVTLYRHTSDVVALASTLRNLGDTYQIREDFDEASSRYEEALTIYRALGEGTDDVPKLTLPEDARDIGFDTLRVCESLSQCRRGWVYTYAAE
jgi:tetratricopeptide (TPR) repeat protein